MPKIYIDTNVFIDIYQSSNDPVGVVDTIAEYASHLVIPEQTVNEFQRNRIGVLHELAKNFGKSVDVKPWFSSLIRHLPEFADLTAAADEFRIRANLILQRLDAARDPANDPVAQKVSELFSRPEATRIPLDDKLIAKAHTRKLLGNPPASPDKYTVGDEVIWEALLATVRDDLIVVTRDRTYITNEQILAREFRDTTRHNLLLVTTRVAEAVKMLGEIPPAKLVEEDDRIEEGEKCPKCGASGLLYESGWFECGRCGYFGPSEWLGTEPQVRADVERYVASTIRLLKGVPQQRPDLAVQWEAAEKIRVIESRLGYFDGAEREHLEKVLAEAHTAARNGQLGLTLACMERVREILA